MSCVSSVLARVCWAIIPSVQATLGLPLSCSVLQNRILPRSRGYNGRGWSPDTPQNHNCSPRINPSRFIPELTPQRVGWSSLSGSATGLYRYPGTMAVSISFASCLPARRPENEIATYLIGSAPISSKPSWIWSRHGIWSGCLQHSKQLGIF